MLFHRAEGLWLNTSTGRRTDDYYISRIMLFNYEDERYFTIYNRRSIIIMKS